LRKLLLQPGDTLQWRIGEITPQQKIHVKDNAFAPGDALRQEAASQFHHVSKVP
jgi:hypothetical protein